MVSRIVIVAVIAALFLVLGPFSVPNWAKVAFVLVLVPVGLVVSGKQKRQERRLALTQSSVRRRIPPPGLRVEDDFGVRRRRG